MNLMNLEMMNGTDRLAEALQMRGLFVEVKNDVISLTAENTKMDKVKVRELLNTLNIPTYWITPNEFQILVNRLPISLMKKIMNAHGREFAVNMEDYHYYWKSFDLNSLKTLHPK